MWSAKEVRSGEAWPGYRGLSRRQHPYDIRTRNSMTLHLTPAKFRPKRWSIEGAVDHSMNVVGKERLTFAPGCLNWQLYSYAPPVMG